MAPTVSVILNSYNQAQYLEHSIESVLGQTFQNFELILTDNGSTDDSQRIAARYREHPKVRLNLHAQNQSISTRFNAAVKLAEGELVSFLYSDDYYLAHKLERQVALFSTLPSDYAAVYAPTLGVNVVTGREWKRPCIGTSGFILRDLLLGKGLIDMGAPLLRRRYLQRYPFFDDLFAEGEAVYLRVAMTGKYLFVDEPAMVMREHESNIGKAIRRNYEDLMVVLDRMADHADFPPALRPELHHFRACMLRNAGWQAVRLGADIEWARQRFWRAVREEWQQALHPRTLVGLCLTLVPPPVRDRLNALGFALRNAPTNAVYRDDYR